MRILSNAIATEMTALHTALGTARADYAGALQTIAMLERANAQLRSEMNWFKHRLNQVERERGQLIQAAIGVKIAVPEFVPTYEDPGAALNEMPNLSTVGGDAVDNPLPDGMNPGVDYSMLPGYKG